MQSLYLFITPKQIQVQRLMQRDNISQEEAKLKMSNQMDIEKKKELADLIIDNSKDLENLQNEIQRMIKEIL